MKTISKFETKKQVTYMITCIFLLARNRCVHSCDIHTPLSYPGTASGYDGCQIRRTLLTSLGALFKLAV